MEHPGCSDVPITGVADAAHNALQRACVGVVKPIRRDAVQVEDADDDVVAVATPAPCADELGGAAAVQRFEGAPREVRAGHDEGHDDLRLRLRVAGDVSRWVSREYVR